MLSRDVTKFLLKSHHSECRKVLVRRISYYQIILVRPWSACSIQSVSLLWVPTAPFFAPQKNQETKKQKKSKTQENINEKTKTKTKHNNFPPTSTLRQVKFIHFFFLTHVFFPLICANTPANSQSTWSQDKHAPLLCHGYDSRLKKPIPRILTNLNARFFCQKIQNTPQHACLLPSYFGQCVHSAEWPIKPFVIKNAVPWYRSHLDTWSSVIGHTSLTAPLPVRSAKLSKLGRG